MLELHPLCTLFPRLSGAEFNTLRDDIKINGLRQPIVLHEGMILDGGNRYRACLDAGVEPVFAEFAGGNLVSFVLSANLHRRHMTAPQQAALVASARDWAATQAHGGDRRSDQVLPGALETARTRAAESGASVSTQRRADAVAKADPELGKKVALGEVSLPQAVRAVAPQLASRKVEHQTPTEPDDVTARLEKSGERHLRKSDPAPDGLEDEAPSEDELQALEQSEAAALELFKRAMEAADPMATALAEVKRLTAVNVVLQSRVDGLLNQNAELVRRIKSLQRQAEKV
jgi:hypothetical protein